MGWRHLILAFGLAATSLRRDSGSSRAASTRRRATRPAPKFLPHGGFLTPPPRAGPRARPSSKPQAP